MVYGSIIDSEDASPTGRGPPTIVCRLVSTFGCIMQSYRFIRSIMWQVATIESCACVTVTPAPRSANAKIKHLIAFLPYYFHRKVIYLRLRIALTLCAIDCQQNGQLIKRAN